MVAQDLPNVLAWVRFLHTSPNQYSSTEEHLPTKQRVKGSNPFIGTYPAIHKVWTETVNLSLASMVGSIPTAGTVYVVQW